MNRFIYLILFLLSSWKTQANNEKIIKSELKQIISWGNEVELLSRNLSNKQYLGSYVLIPSQGKEFQVVGHKFVNNFFALKLIDCESKEKISKKFHVINISKANPKSLFLDKNLKIKMVFKNEEDLMRIKEDLDKIESYIRLQQHNLSKILLLQHRYNFINPRFKKIINNDLLTFKQAQLVFLHRELKKVLSKFHREYSLFNLDRLREVDEGDEFDNLLSQIITIFYEQPSLIRYIDLEILVNFLMHIHMPSHNHYKKDLSLILLPNIRDTLAVLSEKIDSCGHRIRELFRKKTPFSKEEVFDLLRTENDIIFLAIFVENLEKDSLEKEEQEESTENNEERKSLRFSSTLHNLNSFKYVCQAHIFFILTYLKENEENLWKTLVNENCLTNPELEKKVDVSALMKFSKHFLWESVVQEMMSGSPENLRERLDFSYRLRSAGEALKGHIDIAHKSAKAYSPCLTPEQIEERNRTFEANMTRGQAEQKAIELLHSDLSYSEIIATLSPTIRGYNCSNIEVLSIFEHSNLVDFISRYKIRRPF